MGVFNEVFAPCPDCKEYASVQIKNYMGGHECGQFYVDRPDSMGDLSFEEKTELKDYLETKVFFCDNHGPFEITIDVKDKQNRFMF